MKKTIICIIVILAIILIGAGIYIINKENDDGLPKTINIIDSSNTVNASSNNDALIVGIDGKNEDTNNSNEELKKEPVKDAATLTQEIYNLNRTIGTIYIPKTKLETEVYCNSSTSQMDKMPVFLYTTGGLNKTGVTLIVGHNKRNGKIFSNNKKLSEGDEFYFQDYEGNQKKYIIYSKFITSSADTSFLNENVTVPTIALSCCTDASNDDRIILLGRAE